MTGGEIDQVLDLLEESTVPNVWRRDNPAEAEALELYRAGETTGEPVTRTKFGRALATLITLARDEPAEAKPDDPDGGIMGRGPTPG